jgi:hypothetical protein
VILDVEGKAGRNAVHVNFAGVAALRLQEKLVAGFLGKLDDLILDRGTIARAHPFNAARIERRLMEVLTDDGVGLLGRMSDPTGYLFHVELVPLNAIEGKEFLLSAG